MHSILKRLHLAASLQQCSKPLEKRYWKDVCTINLKIVVREARSIEHRGTQMARNLLMIMTVTKCFLWLPVEEYRSSFWTDFGRMPSTTFQLFFVLKDFLLPSLRLLLLRSKNELLRGAKYNVMCNTLTTMCVYIKEREKRITAKKGSFIFVVDGDFPFFSFALVCNISPLLEMLVFFATTTNCLHQHTNTTGFS